MNYTVCELYLNKTAKIISKSKTKLIISLATQPPKHLWGQMLLLYWYYHNPLSQLCWKMSPFPNTPSPSIPIHNQSPPCWFTTLIICPLLFIRHSLFQVTLDWSPWTYTAAFCLVFLLISIRPILYTAQNHPPERQVVIFPYRKLPTPCLQSKLSP